MKKSMLLVAAMFSIAVMFTSCKETKKEEAKTESHENHEHEKGEMASDDAYQCPMDCEKGKTYGKEGSCPVCKMDLKAQKGDSDTQHAEGCKCKEGGECKCEDGKCQCKAETTSAEKECAKCEPGKCTCKDEAKKEAVLAPTKGCSSKCASKCGSKA